MAVIDLGRAPGSGGDGRTWITVARQRCGVLVSVRGDLDADAVSRLRHALVDLVEDQGNLAVHLDLPELHDADSTLMALLADTALSLEALGGTFVVRSPAGEWRSSSPAAGSREASGVGRRRAAADARLGPEPA